MALYQAFSFKVIADGNEFEVSIQTVSTVHMALVLKLNMDKIKSFIEKALDLLFY
jgi:hypothetical protein